jgi:hypothetical protein
MVALDMVSLNPNLVFGRSFRTPGTLAFLASAR